MLPRSTSENRIFVLSYLNKAFLVTCLYFIPFFWLFRISQIFNNYDLIGCQLLHYISLLVFFKKKNNLISLGGATGNLLPECSQHYLPVI